MAYSIAASVPDGWAVVLITSVGGARQLRLRLTAHVELVCPGRGFLCLLSLWTWALKSAPFHVRGGLGRAREAAPGPP